MHAHLVSQSLSLCRRTAATLQVMSQNTPQRYQAEDFIRGVFAKHYAARITLFAPDLMIQKEAGRMTAAAGWRGAASGPLFLETYLDEAVQTHIGRLAAHPVTRERIAEVGNLASITPGGGARMILNLAKHLDSLGFEWVVFTATRELIGIFAKLGLPPLALAVADPSRLGADAQAWGHYYDSRPVVVAGRIRSALERMQHLSESPRG